MNPFPTCDVMSNFPFDCSARFCRTGKSDLVHLAGAKIYHALVIKSMDAERRVHYRYEV